MMKVYKASEYLNISFNKLIGIFAGFAKNIKFVFIKRFKIIASDIKNKQNTIYLRTNFMLILTDFVINNIIPLYTITEWYIILCIHLKWKIGNFVNDVVGQIINTNPATIEANAINARPASFRDLFLKQVNHKA